MILNNNLNTMKNIINCLLFIISFTAFSQKTITTKVVSTSPVFIDRIVSYNTDNAPTDTLYYMSAIDSRYKTLIEIIRIKQGSLEEIYSFIKDCRQFMSTEIKGTSSQVLGNYISLNQLYGMKYLHIYGIGDNSNGYLEILANNLDHIITNIEFYAKKNKIVIAYKSHLK